MIMKVMEVIKMKKWYIVLIYKINKNKKNLLIYIYIYLYIINLV